MKRGYSGVKPVLMVIIVTIFTLAVLFFGGAGKEKDLNPKANERTQPKEEVKKTPEVAEGSSEKRDKSELKNLSILILANKQNPLTKNYVPKDLVEVKGVRFVSGIVPEKRKMTKEAAEALGKMASEAEGQNLRIYCVSGYRSYGNQYSIYNEQVKLKGKDYADRYVAVPGHSEHQTGLAMDLTIEDWAKDTTSRLSEAFGETSEGKWVRDNAYKFGFIIRYPRGKEAITGYSYEPWHIRYVGIEAAGEIKAKGITLEEYLGIK